MRKLKCILPLLLLGVFSQAQEQHKIIYDLSNGDTAVHATVLRHFNGILKDAPNTHLEVVVHGKAVNMMVKNKAYFEAGMNELKKNPNVSFKVCGKALDRLNLDKNDLIGVAEVVPDAILEFSSKQKQGWTYIKAGN